MGMLGQAEPKQGLGMLDLGEAAGFARETLIIPGTSTALTSSVYNPSGQGGGASKATIGVEGANIRWWAAKSDAGTVLTPTEANGFLAVHGDVIELASASEITNFRALRVETNGVSALQVQYQH